MHRQRLIGVLLTASLLVAPRPIAALSRPGNIVSEDVPVPGGTAALTRAIGIEPIPDRARFVTELARLIYSISKENRETADSTFRRLMAHLQAVGRNNLDVRGSTPELVPIPLTAAVWSQAVFHRPVASADLFTTVMSDHSAALLAYGLAALDDETLQFLIDQPAVIGRLYEHDAAVFAAFADQLHIHNNRVVVPGGEAAAPLWEAVLNEKPTQPARFVRELFGRNDGRLAYLYDSIGQLDSSGAAFALGLWIDDASLRCVRFKALASAATSAFGEWDVKRLPFTRPAYELMSMLSRVQVDVKGAPRPPASRTVWAEAFDVASRAGPGASSMIDAAWLAETAMSGNGRSRSDRLDQFAFGQRVFAAADATAVPDVLVTLKAFPRFRMLMLTLERIGIRQPAVYAALAHHAQRLSALDGARGHTALAQFQGAIALVARLARVRTIDVPTAETLLVTLAAVPLNHDGRYAGGVAQWVNVRLRSVLAPGSDMEGGLSEALAGAAGPAAPSVISWEGQQYRFDLAGPEAQRIRRVRERQGGSTLDVALDLAAIARARSADETTLRAAEPLFERADAALGDALLSLSYAVDLGDSRGKAVLATSIARRHDFGASARNDEARISAAWSRPRQVIQAGVPWHVEGSALGLDVALASLTLRRIHADPLMNAPTIVTPERETFAVSVGLMNPLAMTDGGQDAIAEAIARGERKVEALACGQGDVDALAGEIAMDGRRARALKWTIGNDPRRTRSFFSMTELLYLGGGRDIDLSPWGMSAWASTGCLCTRLVVPGLWTALVGRSSLGLLAMSVPDLNLRVAVMLHELALPAALGKAVLAIAVQDYLDRVRPSDADDWLTLVRTAQDISRERIEDLVAVAAAGGPLVPEMGPKQ